MAKLFAMEDEGSASDVVELEATPQEGEVAEVQVEMAADTAEVAEQSEAVDEGMAAADQLEEVQEVVEQSVEQGEGLDPVAAEALRIAIEAISARVGYNPKSVYALYATENFSSTSSRKANSKMALEGVSEFLADLWKKIKAAVKKMWEKVTAFWDKHLSNLGRAKNALDSMKKKVSEASGKAEGKMFFDEAPSGLVDAFAGKEDITKAVVEGYIASHKSFTEAVAGINEEKVSEVVSAKTISEISAAADDEEKVRVEFVTVAKAVFAGINDEGKAVTLVGGKKVFVKAEEGVLSLERDDTAEKATKLGLTIVEKADLTKILSEALTVISATVKLKEKSVKMQAAINKVFTTVDKELAADAEKKLDAKKVRVAMRTFNKVTTTCAVLVTEVVSSNVRMASAVLKYSSFCLKNWK